MMRHRVVRASLALFADSRLVMRSSIGESRIDSQLPDRTYARCSAEDGHKALSPLLLSCCPLRHCVRCGRSGS